MIDKIFGEIFIYLERCARVFVTMLNLMNSGVLSLLMGERKVLESIDATSNFASAAGCDLISIKNGYLSMENRLSGQILKCSMHPSPQK